MRGAVLHGPQDMRVDERDEPRSADGGDAVVRVVAACVCGSDLWHYRGVVEHDRPLPIGHEFVGVVEEVGAAVGEVSPGDFVIAPFYTCCGVCAHCRHGVSSSCAELGWYDGAQAERVRVANADGTLVALGEHPEPTLVPSLLTLSDVMCTGHHAAVSAGVRPGSTVVVVGDGAVGLCGVLAAHRLGAERIVAMSRHEDRARLAREFGADDVVAERGEEGARRVHELFDGVGADSVLECVGTRESMEQAVASARPGARVGFVGVPHGGPEVRLFPLFKDNIGIVGGMAPARDYIEELLPDVLSGAIEPGRVFDAEFGLEDAPAAYAAMDERRAIKALLRP